MTGKPGIAAVHGVAKSWTQVSDYTELKASLLVFFFFTPKNCCLLEILCVLFKTLYLILFCKSNVYLSKKCTRVLHFLYMAFLFSYGNYIFTIKKQSFSVREKSHMFAKSIISGEDT